MKYKKLTILEHEVEARLLDSVLNERYIPHIIQSYHDTALDGLYQTQKGWGYIKVPEEYFNEVKDILANMRKGVDLNDV